MKLLFILEFFFAACAANILGAPSSLKNNDSYFFFVGDDDKSLIFINSSEPVDEAFIEMYTSDPDNNGYWLFTRTNPVTPQILRFKNDSTILESNFNRDKTTVVLSHGWRGSCNSEMSTMLTKAFLQDQDVNVIVMDWSSLAAQNYMTAKKGVPAVGRGLGQFISWLVTLGVSYERVHVVGFSLGGHLVGNAGKETGGKIQRITALDPAGPLWLSDSKRLEKTDAQYVEVIHTSLVVGYFPTCGNTDFYPNGGIFQPGCITDSCAHSRAYEYMAASLKYNHFKAKECGDLINMQFNNCNGNVEVMGNGNLMPKSPGIYRVNTGRTFPFEVQKYTYM